DPGSGRERPACSLHYCLGVVTVLRGIEVNLLEREARWNIELVPVRVEVLLQIGVAGFDAERIAPQNLRFLEDAVSHHGIIAIETKRNGFAIEHLVVDVTLDQA